MKRIMNLAFFSMEIVLLVGCSTPTAKRSPVCGRQLATTQKADVGVASTTPVPEPKLSGVYPVQIAMMPAPPKEKLLGKWRSDMDCSSVVDTTTLSTGRRSCKSYEWKQRDEFEFFEDGEYVFTEITGVDHAEPILHGGLFTCENVKSITPEYAVNADFLTHMVVEVGRGDGTGQESVSDAVWSPLILERCK